MKTAPLFARAFKKSRMHKVRLGHLPWSCPNTDNRKAKDAGAGPDLGLGKLFRDPNLIGKLATNPRTQKHLADPAFVQKVCSLLEMTMNHFD